MHTILPSFEPIYQFAEIFEKAKQKNLPLIQLKDPWSSSDFYLMIGTEHDVKNKLHKALSVAETDLKIYEKENQEIAAQLRQQAINQKKIEIAKLEKEIVELKSNF